MILSFELGVFPGRLEFAVTAALYKTKAELYL